jgi:hypothetical protein
MLTNGSSRLAISARCLRRSRSCGEVLVKVKRSSGSAEHRDIASNAARTIIVESPNRFARNLAVQLAGPDMLKAHGITQIPRVIAEVDSDGLLTIKSANAQE